jgi:hypothetical protein
VFCSKIIYVFLKQIENEIIFSGIVAEHNLFKKSILRRLSLTAKEVWQNSNV